MPKPSPEPTKLELGKMTRAELKDCCGHISLRYPGCACCEERIERAVQFDKGLLTPAQVRAKLEPLLENDRKQLKKILGPIMQTYWECPVHQREDEVVEMRALGVLYDQVEACMVATLDAAARALLGLPPEAPSPLKRDS